MSPPQSAALDGIDERHAVQTDGLRRHASPLSFLILGSLLAVALTGLLGGRPNPVVRSVSPEASLSLEMPAVIRNGEFFEMRGRVTAQRPIGKLVIGVTPALWRDMTINAFIPAAAGESFKEGLFRFEFGELKAGDSFEFKIDGQINPPLFAGTAGDVVILDGERSLSRAPVQIKVLP